MATTCKKIVTIKTIDFKLIILLTPLTLATSITIRKIQF